MATINPISAALRMTLDLGMEGDKQITKTVSLSNIREAVSADSLVAVVDELANLLEFPVSAVKKHSAGLLVE